MNDVPRRLIQSNGVSSPELCFYLARLLEKLIRQGNHEYRPKTGCGAAVADHTSVVQGDQQLFAASAGGVGGVDPHDNIGIRSAVEFPPANDHAESHKRNLQRLRSRQQQIVESIYVRAMTQQHTCVHANDGRHDYSESAGAMLAIHEEEAQRIGGDRDSGSTHRLVGADRHLHERRLTAARSTSNHPSVLLANILSSDSDESTAGEAQRDTFVACLADDNVLLSPDVTHAMSAGVAGGQNAQQRHKLLLVAAPAKLVTVGGDGRLGGDAEKLSHTSTTGGQPPPAGGQDTRCEDASMTTRSSSSRREGDDV